MTDSAKVEQRHRPRWFSHGSPFAMVCFAVLVAIDLAKGLIYWSTVMALILGVNIGTYVSERWTGGSMSSSREAQ